MIILVCGGRDYTDRNRVNEVLDALVLDVHGTILVQGGARGADALAADWAKSRGVHCAEVRALWDKYGLIAGPRRNRAMLMLKPDLVVAFPSNGPGIKDMVDAAVKAGIKVTLVEPKNG